MLAIGICYIYVELGPTYMWHICKYMGSIWDWYKEKKTGKQTASLFEIDKLNWTGVVWTEKWKHVCERIE